jgi:serine/threonine protein kinase
MSAISACLPPDSFNEDDWANVQKCVGRPLPTYDEVIKTMPRVQVGGYGVPGKPLSSLGKPLSFKSVFLLAVALLLAGDNKSKPLVVVPSTHPLIHSSYSLDPLHPIHYAVPSGAALSLGSSRAAGPRLSDRESGWTPEYQKIYDEIDLGKNTVGRGMDGAVYHHGDSPYAVKILKNVEMGQKEAGYLKLFSDRIPGVFPKFYASTIQEGRVVIIMEYIKGITLKKAINDGLKVKDATAKLTRLISQLHGTGFAHGDLNAGLNIIITPEGEFRLIDPTRVVELSDGMVPREFWALRRLLGMLDASDADAPPAGGARKQNDRNCRKTRNRKIRLRRSRRSRRA